MTKIDKTYIEEKCEAYEVAINALRFHESESDIPDMSARMRNALADKLDREIDRWMSEHGHKANR